MTGPQGRAPKKSLFLIESNPGSGTWAPRKDNPKKFYLHEYLPMWRKCPMQFTALEFLRFGALSVIIYVEDDLGFMIR